MNDIQIFNNPEFGDIRTVVIDNEPWFVGKDVADILGYQNGSRDINRHVDEEDKRLTKMVSQGQNRDITVINESGLYSLIFGSKLESAKKFKKWVTSEVLPSIRKTGTYMMPQTTDGKIALLAQGHTELKSRRIWKALRWTCRYFRWKPTALRKLSERKAFQSWEENSRAHTAIVDYAKRFTTTCMLI